MEYPGCKSKEGGVLLIVMFMVLLVSVLGVGILKVAGADALETSRGLTRARAFWLAEAGLREFVAVVSEPVNRTRLDWVGNGPGLLGAAVLGGTLPGTGSYSVDIEENASSGSVKEYRVVSTGTALNGEQARVELYALTETFAVFTYASHIEGNIWFSTGDEVGREGAEDNGVLHSNGRFQIDGKPTIWAEARSASSKVEYDDRRNERVGDPEVFRSGLELAADEISFGDQNFEQIKRIVPSAARLSGDYTLEFNDEVYYLTNERNGVVTTNYISALAGSPNERIIYVEGDVSVKGNVGTEVSVAAEGSIYIVDDIVYTSSLSQDNSRGYLSWDEDYAPDPDEVLGLFSETRVQVVVGKNQVKSHQPTTDVNIHATILVTDSGSNSTTYGGFGAAWDGKRKYSYSVPYGNLFLYGSLSQYRRAAVGLVSGKGYTKRYNYDDRLASHPPPGTPYSAYEFSKWRKL